MEGEVVILHGHDERAALSRFSLEEGESLLSQVSSFLALVLLKYWRMDVWMYVLEDVFRNCNKYI